jgi:hypothetical protein
MNVRRRPLRIVALAVVVALPLFGNSGVASAKAKAPGCRKTHTCKSGSGGPSAPITVQVDPNPVVETGQSYVLAIVQVETSPAYAGDPVEIESPQLLASCAKGYSGFLNFTGGGPVAPPTISVPLDNEGNVTAIVLGDDCAPGTDLVEASLGVAPFYTATVEMTIAPPSVTTPGVYGYPTTSGTVTGGEVETGDSGPTASAVYAVFYVETDPVYAEQTVEISSPELQDRCGAIWNFESFAGLDSSGVGSTFLTRNTATTPLDDDGNAVFFFDGASCAAGSSIVTVDVEAGTHPTYTTTLNVLPPQPTI